MTYNRGKQRSGHWIKAYKRLTIYLRDDFMCLICRKRPEAHVKLSLDYIKPCSQGGKDSYSNLITTCVWCKAKRGDRDLGEWLRQEKETEEEAWGTLIHIESRVKIPLTQNRAVAAVLLDRHGSYGRVMSFVFSVLKKGMTNDDVNGMGDYRWYMRRRFEYAGSLSKGYVEDLVHSVR